MARRLARYPLALALVVATVCIGGWWAWSVLAPDPTIAVILQKGVATPDRLVVQAHKRYRLALLSVGDEQWLAARIDQRLLRLHSVPNEITYTQIEAPGPGQWTLQAGDGAQLVLKSVAGTPPAPATRALLVTDGQLIGGGPLAPAAELAFATPQDSAQITVDGRRFTVSAGALSRTDVTDGPVSVAAASDSIVLPIETATRSIAPFAGSLAPGFALGGLDGARVTLKSFAGSGVILNFWATWCTPCLKEFPLLMSLAKALPPKVALLSVNYKETPDAVRAYLKRHSFALPLIALDQAGTVADDYIAHALPTTFFIDADGVVRLRFTGQLNERVLKAGLALITPKAEGA